ncbi:MULTISPECIES: RNA polymerase sigma factor [Gordonia]|uniref:DNA-directed RNA polymerase specialized sigma subunit, sigma24-like protein n=1 Tax=Gordonia terrae C-6 TaxID=1316928 RepID=R7YDF1_9ACTN|nr:MULTISPECIES: sigma-70 family RNA polymerase sigma factor [Gordonia]AFR49735.1 DNA-directed RNA polymerase specialized sigma subunit, sigma24-like protein [Gordonia sp. KTR9]EON34012.1 DNA-directed RNA polymerase specialized sigma subunit, sigma24-like protein [Gordonia terrae C-6]
MGPSDSAHRQSLDLSELGDDELAGAAAVGDTEAFDVLVRRVTPGLLRYMLRMVDGQQTAEDLTQETLLDAWKGLPDFAFRSSFRTWMFTIAHRKAADHHRRRRDVPFDDERFAELEAAGPLPSDMAERSLLIDALRAELDNLPATSRAAWWLKEVEGLTLEEIGQVLRITTGSVRGHLQRSRKFLLTRLAPWNPGKPTTTPTATTIVGNAEGGEAGA